jgi:hypothetical protein
LEAIILLGVWQGFCRSQWRSTCKSPAKGPLNMLRADLRVRVDTAAELSTYTTLRACTGS